MSRSLLKQTALAACLTAVLAATAVPWQERDRPEHLAAGLSPSPSLFHGISYRPVVLEQPRPMVLHIVSVDLEAEGIGFLVTPGDPSRSLPLRARTTSHFLSEFGVQVAVNGDLYGPEGGGSADVQGLAASGGMIYSRPRQGMKTPAIYFSASGRVSFHRPEGPVYHAISGHATLVENGLVSENLGSGRPAPFTAIGIDVERRRLLIVVVDGRQAGYSEGATLRELAAIMRDLGAFEAICMDGGGSSTLAIEGADGRAMLVNAPVDMGFPGLERPVGNHLGIFARRRKGA